MGSEDLETWARSSQDPNENGPTAPLRLALADLTRQELVIGTSCITDATGNKGFKTEYVQASALIRIAEALEGRKVPAPRLLDVLKQHEQQLLGEISLLTTQMSYTQMGPGYDQPEGPAFRKSQQDYFDEIGRLDALRRPFVQELATTQQFLRSLEEGGQNG